MVTADSAKGRASEIWTTSVTRSNSPMPTAHSAYQELITQLKEVSLFGSIGSVLGWDERVTMPPGGPAHRAHQSSVLARKVHEQFTSPRIGDLLAAVESSSLPKQDPDVAVN